MKVCSQSVTGLLAGVAIGWMATDARAGGLQPQGLEYPLTRGIPGDQVNAAITLQREGGWILWQDAAIDGQGQGISAIRLSPDGSVAGAPKRVNERAAGEQENPGVAPLGRGRVFCVWQGGPTGFQKIYGRILDMAGNPESGDLLISTGDGEHQVDPVVIQLRDGSLVVAWSSYRQDGSTAYDVFARRISERGELIDGEIALNATRGMNRRSPALAALKDGGFMAAWVTERQVGVRDNRDLRGRALAGYGAPVFAVQITGRSFLSSGEPAGTEQVISESGFTANPILASLEDGRIYAAWTRRDPQQSSLRFDVYGRLLESSGLALNGERRINIHVEGDQYRPRLAVTQHGAIAVWTSMGQDGSWEGVYGRWIDGFGEPSGDEIAINTQAGGGQLLPAITPSPDAGLMIAYSSNQPRTGYELFAQRVAPLLLKARAAGNGQLSLKWPTVAGGVYQLQSSFDAKNWKSIGSSRTASGESDELAISAPGQMVLYRIVRVR